MTADTASVRDPAKEAWRLRLLNRVLALVVLVLFGQVAWQVMRISGLEAALTQSELALTHTAGQMAQEKVQGRREELVRAVNWLDDFYRSPEGLRRPAGLWLPDANKPDGEALAVWILDVYLNARIGGASEADARQAVADQIQATDEWRRRHSR